MRALERKTVTVFLNLAEYIELSRRAQDAWQTVPQLLREMMGFDPDAWPSPEIKRVWEMKKAHDRLTRLGEDPVAWGLPADVNVISPEPDPACAPAPILKRLTVKVLMNASEFHELDGRAFTAGISPAQCIRQCCGFEYRVASSPNSYGREDELHDAHARLVRLGVDPTLYGLPAEMPKTDRQICAELAELINHEDTFVS